MSTFLVYWTYDDIEYEASALHQGAAGRGTDGGILSFISSSNELNSFFSGASAAASSVGARVFGASGRHVRYQHLVSARNTRDALKGHTGGVTGMARVMGSVPAINLRAWGGALGLSR